MHKLYNRIQVRQMLQFKMKFRYYEAKQNRYIAECDYLISFKHMKSDIIKCCNAGISTQYG